MSAVKPLDIGDRIRTGDGPDGWLRVAALRPGTGQVDVMDTRGRVSTMDADVARAHRVDGGGP